jgi:aspartyl/asparaginyl beta-hydroxylase
MHELLSQLSRLNVVDNSTLQGMQREVLNIDEGWSRVYSEYHSGGWWTLSLLNKTSKPGDATIEDCVPVETSLLARMPVTRAFLRNLGLKYMWVRLAKLEPDAFMWEHRDYQELADVERFRLHVPIITNSQSMTIINYSKIHLDAGYIWKLNPIYRHAAGNFGSEPRVHLLIDCYVNGVLRNLLNSEHLDPSWVIDMSDPSETLLEQVVEICGDLAREGYATLAEHQLLKLYHQWRLEDGRAYDLVSHMYELLGDIGRKELWQRNKAKFLGLGQRAVIAA